MGNALSVASAGFVAGSIDENVLDDGCLVPGKFDLDAISRLVRGDIVERTTAALPATTTAAIFTITGRILLLDLIGEVTTVIQTQTCTLKVQANPTATGSSVDLCATLDVTAKTVATLLGLTGTVTDALLSGLAIVGQAKPLVLQAGTIDLVTGATNTGAVKWTARYVPLSDGATLVAA